MKKIIAVTLFLGTTLLSYSQQEMSNMKAKADKKKQKKEKINKIMRLEEEGVPSFNKQNAFGIKLNTDGWGLSY